MAKSSAKKIPIAGAFVGKGSKTPPCPCNADLTENCGHNQLLNISSYSMYSWFAGLGFGIYRLCQGEPEKAFMEVASGAASTVPGIGTAASTGNLNFE